MSRNRKDAYIVPTTLWVLARSIDSWKIRAKPKSDILGFIFPSKRILLAFKSRCITRKLESRWRYRRPLATPWMMLSRRSQLSSDLLLESSQSTINLVNTVVLCFRRKKTDLYIYSSMLARFSETWKVSTRIELRFFKAVQETLFLLQGVWLNYVTCLNEQQD